MGVFLTQFQVWVPKFTPAAVELSFQRGLIEAELGGTVLVECLYQKKHFLFGPRLVTFVQAVRLKGGEGKAQGFEFEQQRANPPRLTACALGQGSRLKLDPISFQHLYCETKNARL